MAGADSGASSVECGTSASVEEISSKAGGTSVSAGGISKSAGAASSPEADTSSAAVSAPISSISKPSISRASSDKSSILISAGFVFGTSGSSTAGVSSIISRDSSSAFEASLVLSVF